MMSKTDKRMNMSINSNKMYNFNVKFSKAQHIEHDDYI